MQSRYYCPECRRQTVKPESAVLPFNGTHCPWCGGQYFTLVRYIPAFPGADYDPEATDAPKVPAPEPVPTPPNMTLLLSDAEGRT